LVSAGDVRVSLANVEPFTIRVRLLICSVDKAEQIGLNWWKYDPHLTMQAPIVPATLPRPLRAATEKRRVVRQPVARAGRSKRRAQGSGNEGGTTACPANGEQGDRARVSA